ncbi:MAG: DUF4258 domain-containing protein [Gammaproteobacteria bacterium]
MLYKVPLVLSPQPEGGSTVTSPFYTLTEHARKVLAERQIPLEWLERVLHRPGLREPDPDDASLERRYRPITEFDGRVLRVGSTPRLNRCAW